jgi:hypothetical protein
MRVIPVGSAMTSVEGTEPFGDKVLNRSADEFDVLITEEGVRGPVCPDYGSAPVNNYEAIWSDIEQISERKAFCGGHTGAPGDEIPL